MTDPSARALGRKIAFYRNQRGLSQKHFGDLIGRSETWVSQVERGLRRLDRMTVLRAVAEALDVPVAELAADTPIVAAASSRPAAAQELRMLLSSSLHLALAVTAPTGPVDLAALNAAADESWRLAHATAYDALYPLLADVLPRLEAATRAAKGRERRAAFAALAKIYHAAAAALVKLGELAAAWVAADRAIAAAEGSGDLLRIAEGAFRLTLVFQAARQYDHAKHTAVTAIDALRPLTESGNVEALSVAGALHLQLAVVAARQNEADQAHRELAAARTVAEKTGDRNDYNTEFGPTNVMLHEVGVAVELGDAGTALRTALAVDANRLSPERRGRLYIDIARAQLQRRNVEGAIRALLDAEQVTPEQMHHHWLVHNLMRDLDSAGYGRDPRVRALAERIRQAA